jgi:hypothetical protein
MQSETTLEELREIKLLTDQIKANLLEIHNLLPIDPEDFLTNAARDADSLKQDLKAIEGLLPVDPENSLDSLATISEDIWHNLKKAAELKAEMEE